jgi:ditrans,polycis-polyprenyl diphosphate synthase
MPSWFDTVPITWYDRLGIRILKAGPIPKHIAIIMDGNRRYAESYNMDRMHGHSRGLDKLVEVILYRTSILQF